MDNQINYSCGINNFDCESILKKDFNKDNDIIKLTIKLNMITDVKKFIEITNKMPNIILAKSGEYCVNAKSIMGLFSLDLSCPIDIEVRGLCNESFLYELQKYNEKRDVEN